MSVVTGDPGPRRAQHALTKMLAAHPTIQLQSGFFRQRRPSNDADLVGLRETELTAPRFSGGVKPAELRDFTRVPQNKIVLFQ